RVATIQEPGVTGTIQFGYNADLNQTSIQYPGNSYVCTSYDVAQRISQVVSFNSATASCANPPATTISKFVYSYTSGGADTDLRQTLQASYASNPATTLYYCYDSLAR